MPPQARTAYSPSGGRLSSPERNCFWHSSRARSGAKSASFPFSHRHSSRAFRKSRRSLQSQAAASSTASRGANRPSSLMRCSSQPGPVKAAADTSPVEMSQKQTPAASWSRQTAAMKLFFPSSSMEDSMRVPGVTMRMMSRSTRPLAVAGSSICSQMATL